MFNQYFQLSTRIQKHYVSPEVLLCLVSGRFIPPIHRENLYGLQYSMLPAHRFGIAELWKQLNEAEKMAGKMNGTVDGSGYGPALGNGTFRTGHMLNGTARRRKR